MTTTPGSEVTNSHEVGQALLAVANAIQSVAHVMLGETEKKDTEKKKQPKKERDPNAPKRNLTSYIYFVQDVRESIVKDDPSLSAIDVAKVLGTRWNALSDKEKQPYIKLAEKDKKRFDKEVEEYKHSNGLPSSPPKNKPAEENKKRALEPPATTTNKKKAKSASKTAEVKPEPKQESNKKKNNKKK